MKGRLRGRAVRAESFIAAKPVAGVDVQVVKALVESGAWKIISLSEFQDFAGLSLDVQADVWKIVGDAVVRFLEWERAGGKRRKCDKFAAHISVLIVQMQ